MERVGYMKPLAIAALFIILATQSHATNLLWSTTYTLKNASSLVYAVGKDGAVALADGPEIAWYNREGTLLTNAACSSTVRGFGYLTKDEILAIVGTNVEIFQWNNDGSLRTVTMPNPFTMFTNEIKFDYPYILSVSGIEAGLLKVELRDLSNFSAPTLVGDVVIGVFGQNLKVRWKTIFNAKYRVQISTDLQTWENYTDIIDGTGSTKIINIPLDENSNSLYARVIRL